MIHSFISYSGHNVLNYDLNFFLNAITSHPKIYRYSFLPRNTERLRSMEFNRFYIIDSAAHLNASLGKLSQVLSEDSNHEYPILSQAPICQNSRGEYEGSRRDMLLKKLAFPYQIAVSLEALRSWTRIPPMESFYSALLETFTINEEERLFAQNVFDTFECRHMEDFMILYMK